MCQCVLATPASPWLEAAALSRLRGSPGATYGKLHADDGLHGRCPSGAALSGRKCSTNIKSTATQPGKHHCLLCLGTNSVLQGGSADGDRTAWAAGYTTVRRRDDGQGPCLAAMPEWCRIGAGGAETQCVVPRPNLLYFTSTHRP